MNVEALFRPHADRVVRVGLAGAGVFGRSLLFRTGRARGFQVVAVADPDTSKGVAGRLGGALSGTGVTRPLLVVVSGKPGSGKSTLAQRLGDRSQLWLPVVSHDAVRSALRPRGSPSGILAGVPTERSIALFYATLRHYLEAGASVIADLSWRRGISEPDLSHLLPLARPVNVHCELPIELAHARFVEREQSLLPDVPPEDGPAGGIVRQMAEGAFPWHLFDPLDLDMPRIVVDTSDGYRPALDEVMHFCRPISQDGTGAPPSG